jgi:hypothetical protein
MDERARSAQVSQRHLRGLLQTIDEQPETEARHIRSLLADHGLVRVEAGTETWLPVELLVAWVEAIEKAYDRARVEALFHRFAFVESKASILRSFVGGALRMFGSGGRVLARKIPSGMTLMYRDLGQVNERGVGAHEHEISIDDLPATCASSKAYVAAVGAYYQGLFDALKVAGAKISIAEHQPEKARVVYHCAWT